MSFNFNKEKTQKPRLVVVSSNGSVNESAVAHQRVAAPLAAAIAAKHLVYSKVIKAEDLRGNAAVQSFASRADSAVGSAAGLDAQAAVKVDRYSPSEVVGKRAAVMPVARSSSESQSRLALEGLKKNLQALNDLQARLRFMMVELEGLVERS